LPQHTKTQIAFSSAAAVVAAVALVWATTLGSRFEDNPVVAVEAQKAELKEEGGRVSAFFGRAKSQLGSVADAVRSIRIETGTE
jgi:uncharacterized membrane protein